ncbi:MAG: NAD(P)H-binding protein [Porphyrobacter sp.]|nr:NAD(P)H-binding protein [Porphyrobacter sp.]
MNETQTHTAPRRVIIAGASGTIGRAVVREWVRRGAVVTALVRPSRSGPPRLPEFAGATCVAVSLADTAGLSAAFAAAQPDCVISCIASRSGGPKDADLVDREHNLALLKAAQGAGADHFILLSAICVQKPLLAFQHAKLAFEAVLRSSGMDYTIVRPTAFFKSLSGQLKRVKKGKPFLIFGDGELTRCKPISDDDLARFIADCAEDPARRNAILPIGGPGPAISLREQGALIFELLGQEPRYKSVSPTLFTKAEKLLSLGAGLSDWFAEKAEYARIARYYATESMLVLDPVTGQYSSDITPEYGTETLRDHYAKALAEL